MHFLRFSVQWQHRSLKPLFSSVCSCVFDYYVTARRRLYRRDFVDCFYSVRCTVAIPRLMNITGRHMCYRLRLLRL